MVRDFPEAMGDKDAEKFFENMDASVALQTLDRLKRKLEEEQFNSKRLKNGSSDAIGFDGTFKIAKYQGVVDKNDLAMIKKLASFFYTHDEIRNLGKLLGHTSDSKAQLIELLNFNEDEMNRIRIPKEAMAKDPIAQFYDFVDTILKFLDNLRGVEASLDTSNFVPDERRRDLLTVDSRPYDIVDLELQTPDYFSSKNAIWRRGQSLTDTDIFDPWLRAHNVFVKTSDGISLTNPQAGYLRSRTPYELAITEAIYYSHKLMGEMIALEQGLFRVRWTDAPVFDSDTAVLSDEVEEKKGLLLSGKKIAPTKWINSFEGPVNLPSVDHNTGKCKINREQPMHIYFQPKYTKVENYPNPWLSLWISNYGSTSRGMNEPVFQRGGEVKLEPHLHTGDGGPIGFNNWAISGISVAADGKFTTPSTRADMLNSATSKFTSFYNNLTRNSGIYIKPTTSSTGPLGGLAFFPLTRDDLSVEDNTGDPQAFEAKIKGHAKRYKGKCQSLFAKQMAMSDGLTEALGSNTPFEPPLAMFPANKYGLPAVTNLAEDGWPKWNFVEACQIHPSIVWEAMAKCHNHPIHVCPRLRKAYIDSGANTYVKSKVHDCQRRVYNRYKQLVGTETSGTMFTSNSDGMVIYNESASSCGPGQQAVFRDADGKVLSRDQALVRGSDGKMYFREGVPPENVSCEQKVAVVEKPGTAIGFNEALNVQQIQAEGERRRQLANESSYMPNVHMMDTSEQTVNIGVNTKIDSSAVQPLLPPMQDVFRSLDAQQQNQKQNKDDKESSMPSGFQALMMSRRQDSKTRRLLADAKPTMYIDDHRRMIYQDLESGQHFVLAKRRGSLRRVEVPPSKLREYEAEFRSLVYDL